MMEVAVRIVWRPTEYVFRIARAKAIAPRRPETTQPREDKKKGYTKENGTCVDACCAGLNNGRVHAYDRDNREAAKNIKASITYSQCWYATDLGALLVGHLQQHIKLLYRAGRGSIETTVWRPPTDSGSWEKNANMKFYEFLKFHFEKV